MRDCALSGKRPTGLHLIQQWTQLSPAGCMELAAVVGMVLASLVLVFHCFRDSVVFALLWYLYFSCFQVGQTFLWFQWDTLLLEAGFLAIVVAPLRVLRGSHVLPHDRISLFLVKWLTFRMMFASGVVKLTSECPTWWGLTALHHHFESQCIPTPLAWFAHQAPDWLKKLSVVFTYVVEIGLPPLFLLPIKHLRKVGCYAQWVFMLGIVLTGNYNFFNFLYAAICIPLLLDSSHDTNFGTSNVEGRIGRLPSLGLKCLVIGGVYAVLTFWTIRLFNLRLGPDGFSILSNVAFSKADFYGALAIAVPLFMVVGAVLLATEILAALFRCVTDSDGVIGSLWSLMQTIVVSAIAIALFSISLVPLSYLDEGSSRLLFPEIRQMHEASDKFQLTHSYGLFRSMTGVGGRPEVVMEVSESEEGPWTELEFLYKPGHVAKPPPFVLPHQPRVDWQMWFAALGDYRRNPWLLGLTWRVMHNQPEVMKLVNGNAWKGRKGPSVVRAQLYLYSFTQSASGRAWWSRKLKSEYMPAMRSNDTQLISYLTQNAIILKDAGVEKGRVAGVLGAVREAAEVVGGPEFVWGLTAAVLLVYVAKRGLF